MDNNSAKDKFREIKKKWKIYREVKKLQLKSFFQRKNIKFNC